MGKASQNAECKFSEFYQYVVKLPFVYLSVCLSGYLFIRLFYSYYHYHAFSEKKVYIKAGMLRVCWQVELCDPLSYSWAISELF